MNESCDSFTLIRAVEMLDQSKMTIINQVLLLINTCSVIMVIRYSNDLWLLNVARVVTRNLIDLMYHNFENLLIKNQLLIALQQFLAIAQKKRPRINKI